MKTMPKTIQIFLPSGDPRGIRIAEITTRIVQVIEVPRSLIGEFFKMDESNQVAIYFFLAEKMTGAIRKSTSGKPVIFENDSRVTMSKKISGNGR